MSTDQTPGTDVAYLHSSLQERKEYASALERWLPVVGWEGRYEVSDQGRVRSVPHTTEGRKNAKRPVLMPFRGRILKPATKPSGHLEVRLSNGTRLPTRYVHALVLEAFVGPRPAGMEACDADGNPANNRVDNLRWDTRQANMLDKVKHGNHPFASRTECVNGHPFTPENTYTPPGRPNSRMCRQCGINRKAIYRARKKAAA